MAGTEGKASACGELACPELVCVKLVEPVEGGEPVSPDLGKRHVLLNVII
jgi:hypothetical protein